MVKVNSIWVCRFLLLKERFITEPLLLKLVIKHFHFAFLSLEELFIHAKLRWYVGVLSFFVIRSRAHFILFVDSSKFILLVMEVRVEFWVDKFLSDHVFIVFINILVAYLFIYVGKHLFFPLNELKDTVCNYAFVAIGYIYLCVIGIVDAVRLLVVVC